MFKKLFLLLTFVFIAVACSSSDDDSTDDGMPTNFDRAAILTNWSDNIIIPIYQDLNAQMTDLVAKKGAFVSMPNATNLEAFRTAWYKAYKVWQYAEMFNIGRAEELGLTFQMNIYPTNVTDIQNNIQSQNYDLTSPNNNDAVGFPALDYMLYGLAANDTEILEFYTTHTDASKYLGHLSDLTNQMKSLVLDVNSSWSNYRSEFISASDNTATGSINRMVNDFVFYFEKGLRANKIGIPAGNFSATPLSDKVEAFYRGDISKELATQALTAVKDFFNGKAYNNSATGESLKSYLDFLNSIRDGEDLSVLINNQFNTAQSKIDELDANFSTQIETDNTKMTEAYDALQMAVVLLKVDMLQALNVSVDYVDADGD